MEIGLRGHAGTHAFNRRGLRYRDPGCASGHDSLHELVCGLSRRLATRRPRLSVAILFAMDGNKQEAWELLFSGTTFGKQKALTFFTCPRTPTNVIGQPQSVASSYMRLLLHAKIGTDQ